MENKYLRKLAQFDHFSFFFFCFWFCFFFYTISILHYTACFRLFNFISCLLVYLGGHQLPLDNLFYPKDFIEAQFVCSNTANKFTNQKNEALKLFSFLKRTIWIRKICSYFRQSFVTVSKNGVSLFQTFCSNQQMGL